ncbi:hypothetical protein PFLUV_G00090860 [Perca fluviatilis]|uniref:Fucolectin tachylectin-4 pentraxin-1 domain-containing protein n=1 Tax=Perca fluviatilis TaxID=8168 RepID=A0A6A5FCI2_PERFL|nr:hypothetical protein PFLUV_G00090860 [Perca fluviatilis]
MECAAAEQIEDRLRTMKRSSVLLLLFFLGTCSAYTYQNVALRGKATQSNRLADMYGFAHNAIDGNRESDYNAGSCTQTIEQTNPWWRVDLLESYIVTSIIITNRGDAFPERINGAEIHIGNSLQNNGAANPVAGVFSHIPAGQSSEITVTSLVEGRYVTVVLPGLKRVLTLCEVEVYGYRAPTGENLAIQGKASQSSLYDTLIAYNAIDGNVTASGVLVLTQTTTLTPGGDWTWAKPTECFLLPLPTEILTLTDSMALRSELEILLKTMAIPIPGVL